jgi:hypothetical protein
LGEWDIWPARPVERLDMFPQPPEPLASLLREVTMKHHPDMVSWLDALAPVTPTDQQLQELRQSVGSELCETGLTDDDEPNQRGLLLEELVDWLGTELVNREKEAKKRNEEKGIS